MVRMLDGNTVVSEDGPYYVKGKAEYVAKKLSRQFTSSNVTVQLAAVDQDGQTLQARTFRMGKLYRP